MNSKSIWKFFAVAAIAGVAGWLLAATAFVPGDAPVGFMGGLEVTNFNLASGNETVYKTDYEKTDFTGNIYAYPVTSSGVMDRAAERFDGGVSAHLNLQNFDTGRLIGTMKDDGTAIAFRLANLSTAQKTALNATSGDQQATLDYVRGDRSNETPSGNNWRARASLLGDIMHSRPFYLINDGNQPVLLVGANDGMLHAFDVTDNTGGAELWAYVPSMLMSTLQNLKVTPYVHTYYVDGGLNVADVTISGSTVKLAVSTLGAGGKGLFALDVTNPVPADEAAVAAMRKWEITTSKINGTASASYANLGYTYSTPVITKVNSGSGQSVVIIGNGYNPGGNFHSTLYVINAADGTLIRELDTGSGTSASPGGLSTPACIDTNTDGKVDRCYAGDIDGNLWKFDLSSTTAASWPAPTKVYTTSPAQPITMAPSVSVHPNGGFMVNFATGQMFTAADKADATTVYYAYGIWDGAPVANAVLLAQTLTERSFTVGTTTSRVRTVTANPATWTSGATNHKGWRVPLPAGERVTGDTVFTENGRFYFNSYNPTFPASATGVTPVTPAGENWLMELDYLTGGIAVNSPFLDLNGDQLLTDLDRVKATVTPFDTVLTTDGVPVGKFVSNGVSSHPILVQLSTLNTTLFNQNPDVDSPPASTDRGVAGGHFDVDIFYGPPPANICSYSGGTAAAGGTATITVATTGSSNPATLGTAATGGISIGGTVIMNNLSTSDITNGTATTTNAGVIRDRINALTATTGYSATLSGSTVTVIAPASTAGTSQGTMTLFDGPTGAVAATSPTGTFTINNATNNSKSITAIKCPSGGTSLLNTSISTGSASASNNARVVALATGLNTSSKWSNGYSFSCTVPVSPSTTSVCTVTGPPGVAACSNLSISRSSSSGITLDSTSPAFSGGSAAAASVSNLKPKLTLSGAFSAGTAATLGTFSSCTKKKHFHEYDDIFNVTGVNMLNASSSTLNLSKAIADPSTPFKVLVHNQYLNPAVTLSVGGAAHESVKTWNNQASETVAATQLSNMPTYTQNNVNTLEWNMPLNAFTQKDWWAGASPDVRVGLMPTAPGCGPWAGSSTKGGNLFYPIIPPATITATGQGTASTTQGARHNGALTIQIVKSTIGASNMELNISGKPEYGWRVKSADFETYVLAEYVTYWHHPTQICYGDTGWTKLAAPDNTPSDPSVWQTPAAGSDDPSTGSFRATSSVASVVTTTSTTAGGLPVTTTVTTYTDGTTKTVAKTTNADGTTTIVTTTPDGKTTTETIANTKGDVKTGGDEKGSQAKTGRVSWSELLRN